MCSIFAASLIRRAETLGVDVNTALNRIENSSSEPVLRFPDSSVMLNGLSADGFKQVVAKPVFLAEDPEGTGIDTSRFAIGFFQGLYLFSSQGFQLYHYGDWVAKSEHEQFTVCGKYAEPNETNAPADNYSIFVAFEHKPKRSTAELFADHIARWNLTVREKGIGNEGPILLKSEELEIDGRIAQLRFDISRTGQNTINWLLLSLDSFSEIEMIRHVHLVMPSNMPRFARRFGGSGRSACAYRYPTIA